MVDKNGTVSNTNAALHFNNDPVLTAITPGVIDFTDDTTKPTTYTVKGYHLKQIFNPILTLKATSGKPFVLSPASMPLADDNQIVFDASGMVAGTFGAKADNVTATLGSKDDLTQAIVSSKSLSYTPAPKPPVVQSKKVKAPAKVTPQPTPSSGPVPVPSSPTTPAASPSAF